MYGVGKRLKEKRETAGLNQAELGRLLEVTQAMVSRLESADTTMSFDKAERYAEALHLNSRALFLGHTLEVIERGAEKGVLTSEDVARKTTQLLGKAHANGWITDKQLQGFIATGQQLVASSEMLRMYEELTSGKETVDLSPPQALTRAEHFLTGQGYVVVHRTATTLTAARKDSESAAGRGGAPKVVVMAVPQSEGGVRIKVKGGREGVQDRQGLWRLWVGNLPKRRH